MNKALLDTDIYSEVLKAVNPTIASNAAQYRQKHGVYSLSVITGRSHHRFSVGAEYRPPAGLLDGNRFRGSHST